MRAFYDLRGARAVLRVALSCVLFFTISCALCLATASVALAIDEPIDDHEMHAGVVSSEETEDAERDLAQSPSEESYNDESVYAQSSNSPVYDAGTTGMGMDGVDVSRYQSGFSSSVWTNYQFAIVKATEGTGHTSPNMTDQAEKVLNDGKLLGFYHFARGGNANAEAEHFVSVIRPYIGKAILVLDWEEDALAYGPSYAKTFLDRVYALTGVKPLIYMSYSVTNAYNWSSVANAGYSLWVARYLYRYDNSWLASNGSSSYGYTEFLGYAQNPSGTDGIGNWSSPTIYQYSSTGKVGFSNGHLDINKFYGTADDWNELATPGDQDAIWNLSAEGITETNATVRARVTLRSSAQFTQAGIRIWDSLGNEIVSHTEATSVNLDYMNIWYDISNELGKNLSEGTTYTYQFWCVADGQTYASERAMFTTNGSVQIYGSWSVWAEDVMNTNATLHAKVTASQTVTFTQAGVKIWDAGGNLIVNHAEATNIKLDYMNIWYDINQELGVTLTLDLPYTYQFWCVADGQTLTSDVVSLGGSPNPSTPPQLEGNWSVWADNVSCTNATLYAKITVGQTVSFTETGIKIWDADNNPIVDHEEATSISLDYMNVWYDVNDELGITLTPGTSYTYQFWCVAEGQTLASGRENLTTAELSAIDLSSATVAVSSYALPCTGHPQEPAVTVTFNGKQLEVGVDYELTYTNNTAIGKATVTVTGIGDYEGTATATFRIARAADGWVNLAGGGKGYGRNGRLVTGWLTLGDSKYWFDDNGVMATGWTDLEVDGKTMHYYFNPASGNLARGTWMDIDGRKYYFRPSGNAARGWATISDNGVDKKYYFDDGFQMVTGWQDIEVDGKVLHYYFRPSGSMATGWATIDGQKYWFRASGNMATGFASVDDAYKRYFDAQGHMLTGWREIGGNTYYFRSSGAMQTGEATIDGMAFIFTDKGVLIEDASASEVNEGASVSSISATDEAAAEGAEADEDESAVVADQRSAHAEDGASAEGRDEAVSTKGTDESVDEREDSDAAEDSSDDEEANDS